MCIGMEYLNIRIPGFPSAFDDENFTIFRRYEVEVYLHFRYVHKYKPKYETKGVFTLVVVAVCSRFVRSLLKYAYRINKENSILLFWSNHAPVVCLKEYLSELRLNSSWHN